MFNITTNELLADIESKDSALLWEEETSITMHKIHELLTNNIKKLYIIS